MQISLPERARNLANCHLNLCYINLPMKSLTKALLAVALLAAVFGARAQPAPNPAPEKAAYVASTKSQVFHKSDCQWVAKIDPKNRQTFQTREEAIKAGKRPCKVCKP